MILTNFYGEKTYIYLHYTVFQQTHTQYLQFALQQYILIWHGNEIFRYYNSFKILIFHPEI